MSGNHVGNPFLLIVAKHVDRGAGMDFIVRGRQPVVDQKPREPIYNIFRSDIRRQSRASTYPNRFSRDRCLLLIRFLIVLAFGATMFQVAMLVRYYSPSNLLVSSVLFALSLFILSGALIDLRRILKLRSQTKRM